MLRYVRNVTGTDYILKGEINTVNGMTPLEIRIIKGGVYEVDTHVRYSNLDEALQAGDLIPAYEDKPVVKVAKPDKATETPEKNPEPEITEEVPDNESVEEEVEEEPIPAEEKPGEVNEVADSTESEDFEIPEEPPFICPICSGEYASKNNLIRHIENKHKNPEQ